MCKHDANTSSHMPNKCQSENLHLNTKHTTFALEILQAIPGALDMEIAVTNLKSHTVMKKNQMTRLFTFAVLMALSLLSASAQAKVDDKEIVGVWIMESMKYIGEDKNHISDKYNQVKVYRANGEYACAQIVWSNGQYRIAPHEYGTYYLKNGMYSEMGRAEIKYQWVDKTTSNGRWNNRIDTWKKIVDFPAALEQHIIDKCKAADASPEDMQKLMKKYIFKK